MLTNNAIHELASDKVFAKLTMLDFDLERLRDEVKYKITGKLTLEQLVNIYDGTVRERAVWNYIAESIEKSNKN
tara:strand:- start:22 stop:243 length:222 start_codon:yes stop_codon:yes gene_type:complete